MLRSPTRIAAVSLLSALFFSANAAAEFDVEEAQDLYRQYSRYPSPVSSNSRISTA